MWKNIIGVTLEVVQDLLDTGILTLLDGRASRREEEKGAEEGEERDDTVEVHGGQEVSVVARG